MKSPHSQAHSGGCNFGKGAAGGADDGAVCAGGLSDAEAAAARSISFAPPQAAGLIHSVVPPFPTKSTTLWEPFCGSGMPCGIVRSPRGDCGCCDSLQTMPQRLQVLLSSSAQVSVASVLETACDLPAQTCHRQLCRRDGRVSCPSIFSFAKEKLKKGITVSLQGRQKEGVHDTICC